MHAKSDSEVTSIGACSPTRQAYYVQSPSNHDVEKMSYGSSPINSPEHHHHLYHSSPIHHSRESSTSRFSVSLKNSIQRHSSVVPWKRMHRVSDIDGDDDDGDDDGGYGGGGVWNVRLYVCSVLVFIALFSIFALILWACSKEYSPQITVKNIVFHGFNRQAGTDNSGVPTDMLSLNSTVRIFYRNPATFFGVHVSSTPVEIYYAQLKIASGQMEDFCQSRTSQRRIATVVMGHQVPLYGGLSMLDGFGNHQQKFEVPLNLTFTMRSRAHILGKLVRSKFYKSVRCGITLTGAKLGEPHNVTHSCTYR